MAYRILIAAALAGAFASPALADQTTTYTTTTSCNYQPSRTGLTRSYSGCVTQTQVQRPDPPPRPNCAYLPNFGGVDPRCYSR